MPFVFFHGSIGHVLRHSKERAWYDHHRADLLPEPDADDVFEDIRRGFNAAEQPRRRYNDPGLAVKHILRFFDATAWSMDDGPQACCHYSCALSSTCLL
jgi:DnaJ family protein A protein 5